MSTTRLGKLDVTIEGSMVRLAGKIDDTTQLGDHADKLPTGRITIDTGAVTFVNSIGVREWMRFLRALHKRGDEVTLARLAEVLLQQMNLIPGFKGLARIASFHAPYTCGGCGADVLPLVDAVAHAGALRELRAPSMPCPECGAQMELGDFPERYLTIFRA